MASLLIRVASNDKAQLQSWCYDHPLPLSGSHGFLTTPRPQPWWSAGSSHCVFLSTAGWARTDAIQWVKFGPQTRVEKFHVILKAIPVVIVAQLGVITIVMVAVLVVELMLMMKKLLLLLLVICFPVSLHGRYSCAKTNHSPRNSRLYTYDYISAWRPVTPLFLGETGPFRSHNSKALSPTKKHDNYPQSWKNPKHIHFMSYPHEPLSKKKK